VDALAVARVHPPSCRNSNGQFSLAIISAMDPDFDRCKYGTGNVHLSREEHKRNIQYLHNLDEAMRIDTFLAGTERFMNSHNICTSALLLSTFDVAILLHFRTREASKYGGNIESFEDFAFDVHNAQSIGTTWIESHCDPLLNNQHRVLLGWAYVLSRQFVVGQELIALVVACGKAL